MYQVFKLLMEVLSSPLVMVPFGLQIWVALVMKIDFPIVLDNSSLITLALIIKMLESSVQVNISVFLNYYYNYY